MYAVYKLFIMDKKTRGKVSSVGVRGIWVKGVRAVLIVNMSKEDSF
jgi:hypothetical protein